MNPIVENLTGTAVMTDQVIASDLLIAAKSAVRNYAMAITETATPDVRTVLRKQLDDAIHAHEQTTDYMIGKGWYNAYDIPKQIQLDMQKGLSIVLCKLL